MPIVIPIQIMYQSILDNKNIFNDVGRRSFSDGKLFERGLKSNDGFLYEKPLVIRSDWAASSIAKFKELIENSTCDIHHSGRYGKHNLYKLISLTELLFYANDAFGDSKWTIDVIDSNSIKNEVFDKSNIFVESQVRITLKDGTSSQAIGIAFLTSKNEKSLDDAKKIAYNDALKQVLLSFIK
ncbi:hypothetical protein Kpol_1055p88 [Vanderwaltozyma polyspora DSM 70294]|uniref:Uncharacterized protein n=1 Tax=Vanderwaltozyma polyspora (strain ATCC 22028 / DSM 70294 / BCRC 21397 / CBS 2163 / NBRC 10782 / NRRL Y-8283 / UCD 57-17) TaxID=436907 RepID=A7TGG1_VANPO|nr:uncharacterized protein Kpol_1055p88 [Vanderwaltozyma polyspora DSM 70294]EDO18731.1 hypothetical protein Kpol_1055p88 [Vanderwaltozyma polyspora DSM 70294]